jgi:hypothetical protein
MRVSALVAGLIAPMAVSATAATLTTPPLAPGSQYRIVFLTSGTRDAQSTVIGDYNTFVNNAANAGGSLLQPLGATWSVIGSTDAVSAATNIGGVSTLPMYLLDGTFVASGTADLFDGTIAVAINMDELGNNTYTGDAYTGSNADGTIDSLGHALGSMTNSHSEVGNVSSLSVTGGSFLHFQNRSFTQVRPFYGISSTLMVPAAPPGVPEPGTITMLLAGALLMVGARRYHARRMNPKGSEQ